MPRVNIAIVYLVALSTAGCVHGFPDPEPEAEADSGKTTPMPTVTSPRLLRHMSAARVFNNCFGTAKHQAEEKKMTAIYETCKRNSSDSYVRHPRLRLEDVHSGGSPSMDNVTFVRIKNRLGNYSCILEQMDFVDQQHVIKVDVVQRYLEALPTDARVRQSVRNDIEDCHQYSKLAPARLVANSISEYKFLNDNWVRTGIFMHCVRGRLMMVCMEKEMRDRNTPMSSTIGLAMARVPYYTMKNYVFEDTFTVIDESALWFSSAP